jgi:hypothetical protein
MGEGDVKNVWKVRNIFKFWAGNLKGNKLQVSNALHDFLCFIFGIVKDTHGIPSESKKVIMHPRKQYLIYVWRRLTVRRL